MFACGVRVYGWVYVKGWGPEHDRSGPHPLYGVLWRCPTLPHPPRCSTIGACGLSFQVRNGCWAFPRGYDHHKWFNQYSLVSPESVSGVVLVVIRIVATSIPWMSVNPFTAFQLFVVDWCLLVSAH